MRPERQPVKHLILKKIKIIQTNVRIKRIEGFKLNHRVMLTFKRFNRKDELLTDSWVITGGIKSAPTSGVLRAMIEKTRSGIKRI
jgi:hypothetical protein